MIATEANESSLDQRKKEKIAIIKKKEKRKKEIKKKYKSLPLLDLYYLPLWVRTPASILYNFPFFLHTVTFVITPSGFKRALTTKQDRFIHERFAYL